MVQHGGVTLVIGELLPGSCRPLRADVKALERFSALMARAGWTAHVSAMAYDRIYARERFSHALRHGDRELTALAGALLASYRGAGFRYPD
jgi:hypothetical protein